MNFTIPTKGFSVLTTERGLNPNLFSTTSTILSYESKARHKLYSHDYICL